MMQNSGVPRVLLAGTFLSHLGLARSPIEDFADRLRLEGGQPVCASRYRNALVRGVDLLWTTLSRRKHYEVGIVHLYSGRAFWWGDLLTRVLSWLRRPILICLHGGGLPEFALRHPETVTRCLQRAKTVTAPSNYLVQMMRPYRNDIELLRNPLDLSAYEYAERACPAPRLIWLRTFRNIYNPELAPRVLSLLKDRFPGISLLMVGKDWGDGSLQNTQSVARELGVESAVTFPGSITKTRVPSILREHDIFLNTTSIDNTPVSVVEALACGLCVISTNVGGLPHLLEQDEDALLVPPNDAQAMAAAVERVLTEPELAKRISRNGRRKAEQYDWSQVMPQWRRLLASQGMELDAA